MRKQSGRNKRPGESFIDIVKDMGILGLPLLVFIVILCCAGTNECQDKFNKKDSFSPPYRTEDVSKHRSIDNTKTRRKSHIKPVQSEEDKMIDKLNTEDYYGYSDYFDGLDGEPSNIDYNEVRDYFED